MPVTVGDVVRITARMLLSGLDDIVNVYHFKVIADAAVGDAAFMTEVALALDTLYTGINSLTHPLVSFSSVEGQNITKNELLPSTPWPLLVNGANVSEMFPEQLAACVFHRTLTPRVRATKFLPPMGENVAVDGAIVPVNLAAIQIFGDALTNDLTTALVQIEYVAFNRLLASTTAVTQALVPTRFRTQRRRRLGVGS